MATSFTVNKADLEYILKQIQIAEKHASGTSLVQAIQDAYGISATDAALLPAGLRTVDGQDNNLLAGQAEFGAADNPFPRLTDPIFRNDADGDTMPLGPPGGPVVNNTNYGVIGTPTGANGGHSGNVADADPRIISNLIVDMSVSNPAAITAWFANPLSVEAWLERNPGKNPVAPGAAVDVNDVELTNADLAEIPNQSPDIGLSPGFNAFMTFFGQFFDHGLDLVTKSNNGTVFIPLQPDDPLYVPGGNANFMVLTRANPTVDANGVPQHTNTTTSFVDQNQTYTSHASHQVFLREYARVDIPGDSVGAIVVSTGHLLDGSTTTGSLNGAIANWGEVKAQALDMLGIRLRDTDVVNVPLLKTDQYGNFIPGPNGFAQLVMAPDSTHATTWFKEGTAAGITTDGALKTGHAFLDDIAHAANPVNSQTGAFKTADSDATVGLSNAIALSNGSFEADSMTSGPDVIADAVLGNYAFIDPQGWDITGFGGVYAPTAAAIGAAGHSGGNVVFLDNAATLVRNTGVSLQQGSVYQMTFNVGDRLDTNFGGGTARLVATDGTVLATATLPTPADGQWAPVTLNTGAVSAANAGKELRIEFIHGGSGQVLIDNVQLGLGTANSFDNELLDKHFITGDGRGNENIGLTAVHTIFHSEHNRLVEANKETILASGDRAFINEWLLVDIGANDPIPTSPTGLFWDGERLFQAARFVTEMQYQHLVFEEFARRMQPNVDAFVFTNTADVDPSIVAEFAHVVYRFGHSMLTGTVDRLENDLTTVDDGDQLTLINAFLNPQGFIDSGADLEEATGNLIRGLTRDVGNEMDEFIVSDVRSNLLGLPLDLAALNIARGRDTGVPSLNETRYQLYEDFGLADLKPYTSWTDFAQHLKHPISIVNFIAAYGTHPLIAAESTVEGKRAAAMAIVLGTSTTHTVPGDRLDFLNGRGAYAATVNPTNPKDLGGLGGLNDVDLWIGGLAEELNEFGGMLGSTFNFVFEYQMEHLQNGDRLYYLSRTQGLNLLNQLEPNSITDLVMRNTDLGAANSTHLNGALFTTPDMILELDSNIMQEDYNSADPLSKDPIHDDAFLQAIDPKVYRVAPGTDVDNDGQADGGVLKFSGGEHVVLGGTEGNDKLYGDKGIDTLWGDGGNDYLNAGMESDDVFGGDGDDIIEDPFGDDVLRGNKGNDVISAGTGLDLIFGDQGKDFLIVGQDDKEAFGGDGDDFILGGTGKDFLLGGEGDDWIEGGEGFDTIAGENSELFFNSPIIGHDVLWGQGNDQDYDSESGDDIMLSGPGIQRFEGMFGFDWGIAKFDPLGANYDFQIPIFTTIPTDILRDRFDQVEAASGWVHDDILRGDDRGHSGGSSSPDSTPVELFVDHTLDAAGVQRINGLNDLLNGSSSAVITSFKNGNILLGGDGNDLIQGRGGFDVIDGDAWLNVRIAITQTKTGGPVLGTAESLTSQVFAVDANGNATTTVLYGGRPLNALMLDGTLNPGQLQIVREIKYDETPENNVDTVLFQGGNLEYEIEGTRIVYDTVTGVALRREGADANGNASTDWIRDLNGDGFITVRDLDDGTVAAPGRPGALTVSRGALTDDTDRLVNVERLQFADATLDIGSSPNTPATGTVTIQDPTMFGTFVTPIVGQVLTAKLTGVADEDGLTLDANGNPVGLTFEWQTTEAGNDGGWVTITTGLTYTVRPVDPAHVLRAVAVFKDNDGITERIASVGTDNVTAPFVIAENTATGIVIGPIPFSMDYDPLGLGGTGVTDGDIVRLTHAIAPGQDAGGRFEIFTDANGVQQLRVKNGGTAYLNYEDPTNPDHAYEIMVNTYTDVDQATLVAQRQFTIQLTDVNPETSLAPTLDLHAADAGNYLEQFATQSYTGNDTAGTTAWTTSWTETNDGGSPTGGDIEINGGRLRFDQNITGNESITRSVNLTGVSTAILSFDYQDDELDDGENVVVEAFNGTSWDVLDTLGGADQDGSFSFSAQLSPAQIGAHCAIRFRAEGDWENGENFYIDNVNIAFTKPASDGNNFARSYTEDGAAIAISSLPAITDGDGTALASAKIVLTNAKPGDVLTVSGLAGTGITSSVSNAGGVLTLNLTGAASTAAYLTALQAVRYMNTSQNPDVTPRVVQVTVNDGISESNTSTATIAVIAVNDAMNANNDRVVTNIAAGQAFAVGEWAFLANDTGDAPDITALSSNVGLATSLVTNPGSVTITDDVTSGGSFVYTAADGPQTDTANVTVVRDTDGTVSGNDSTTADILVGDNNGTNFDGGTGNDVILAGGGDDTIIWNAGAGAGDGRDIVNGGTEGTTGDTFVVNGNAGTEAFTIYTRAAALEAMPTLVLRGDTEIVIRRQSTGGSDIIVAELSEIEEIRINGVEPTGSTGPAGADTFSIVGDFSGTSLSFNTITIDGSSGDDSVDISSLKSAHRIVFRSNGGHDTIIGTLRAQDVIELPDGATAADYETTTDANGVTTMTRNGHTVTFVRESEDHSDQTQGGQDDDDDDDAGSVDDDGDSPDDDEDDAGEGGASLPVAARTVVGTAAADALLGTTSDDIILGGAAGDILVGDAGDDILRGEDGNDVITGGNGEDSVNGGEGDDELHGGAGGDMLFGGAGKDLIHGEAGDDFIEDGTGDDQVWGGAGNDTILATANDGSDQYWGGDGADTLDYSAASGNLTVDLGNGFMQRGQVSGGNTGTDIVHGFENFVGGSGHDVVTATVAVNIMDGGLGNDVFRFNSVAAADGDKIYGFQPGDKINFSSIDANSTAAGSQGFVLAAGTALTAAGQIVVTHEVQDGEQVTVIHGNVDANTDADFELTLVGKHNLTASDFQGVS
ncbi:Ca2+-binding RTX toxin-like protein [Rhizobium sp. BK077]|uniref:peroxidase family protein n=1 Tax=unclassified Rhizobium TaxID=2613769 RepID=UPI0017C24AF9|nr:MULTISPECIES: peroxidase family protein [unclassified Rhizobium]MBB3302951.1 Ca2+-binding RTX toxin-like protein [Rhizobium sp. BK112]MBB3371844.1 Ca2+-binding RTX toxin-like protein [Rhizobium sp. BK077]MBB4182811.1 Ca2+-binding RTX toxin-like protein [Rhizobium sp. BK109]